MYKKYCVNCGAHVDEKNGVMKKLGEHYFFYCNVCFPQPKIENKQKILEQKTLFRS